MVKSRDVFSECDLPIRVDIADWSSLSDTLKNSALKEHERGSVNAIGMTMTQVASLRYDVIFKKAFSQVDVFTAFVKE